ncbi:MAG: hypothetical protein ACRBN8_42800 [Nannocystales bacterium]
MKALRLPPSSLLSLALLVLSPGCDDGDSGDESGGGTGDQVECGEFGEMHDGHCRCDPGYVEVKGVCVPAS